MWELVTSESSAVLYINIQVPAQLIDNHRLADSIITMGMKKLIL